MLLAPYEAAFFRTLNTFIEPLVRAGIASPGFAPVGVIALETTGRRTGRSHRVPVLAAEFGEWLIVSTVRGQRSDWIKNMQVTPHVRYWLRGRVREANALVLTPGETLPDLQELPPAVRCIVESFQASATLLGVACAVLSSRPSDHQQSA